MFKCPYCGVEILTEKAYWGHVEICSKNPKNKIIEEVEKEPAKNEELVQEVKKNVKKKSITLEVQDVYTKQGVK